MLFRSTISPMRALHQEAHSAVGDGVTKQIFQLLQIGSHHLLRVLRLLGELACYSAWLTASSTLWQTMNTSNMRKNAFSSLSDDPTIACPVGVASDRSSDAAIVITRVASPAAVMVSGCSSLYGTSAPPSNAHATVNTTREYNS